MKRRGVVLKITALAILLLFVTSAVQVGIKIDLGSGQSSSNGDNFGNTRSIWEDNFNDASKIDPGMSDNYIVSGGKASMANTYAVWTDPSWTRMKQINVTNNAGQTLQNYALKMTINRDSDMQSDYRDIRFKHESDPVAWLNYWIENYSSTYIDVWVRIPSLPIGTSKLYLFYGNPSAVNQSDLGGVFSDWNIRWSDDEKITNHATNEGTWDSDVCFGNGEFLVAWEEGTTVVIEQEIRASIYDSIGNKPVDDELVFSDETTFYRNENPSIDYGGGKYFVAWEHYDNSYYGVTHPSTEDIKARTVVKNGGELELGSVIDVCTAADCQADANVQFDSTNNRFCVVWEDARNGESNYNIYGQLYDTNGNPVGGEKGIATTTYSQVEPWVAFDPIHEKYMIVWEEGITANNGPFSLKAGLFDETLTQIGSTITIATGSSSVDYNFPCVEFSQETQCFLVTWNNDDISSGDWWGNVWGKIYDTSGNIIKNTFPISSGEFVRTDIATYPKSNINDPFFVTYNDHYGTDNGKIYGKFVSASGDPSVSSVALSVSSSNVADWANIGVGNGKIFVAWEDSRNSPSSDKPDVYGNMWELTTSTGTSVTYSIGNEINQVLLAHVTSIAITKASSDFWETFNAIGQGSTIAYSILDGAGNVLIPNITPGGSLSGVMASSIRLMATFSRNNPSTTPQLDYWSVTWISNHPPTQPSNPSPSPGATNVGINADLSWSVCTDPDGDPVTYDIYFGTSSSPSMVYAGNTTCTYDPGTMGSGVTYYWQIVAKDSHGATNSSPLWSFTTWINHPPTQPSNPSPAHGAINVDINPFLEWSACTDPDQDPVTYDVYFGINSDPPKISEDQTPNSTQLEDLSFNQLYYWKIVAEDDQGGSNSSPIWNFTTRINHPPYEPYGPSTDDGATGVDINADLSWTGGDPDPGDAVTYDIYFGTSSPPIKVASDYEDTTYDPGQMQFYKTYYWQINAKDEYDGSAWSPIWNFTTGENGKPYPPYNPSPSNHATDVENNTVLSWSCDGDPDPDDTVTYDVYLDIKDPPTNLFASGISTKSCEVKDMSPSTKYYWKIVVKDNHLAQTEGSVWDFTTKQGEVNEPPRTPRISPVFRLIKPNQEYEFKISATEPEGENVFYRISWGDDTITDWLGPYTQGEEQTFTHTWTITKPYTPIAIVVSAKDTNGNKCVKDGVAGGLLPRSIQKSGILLKLIQFFQEHHPLLNLLKKIIMWHPILNRLS